MGTLFVSLFLPTLFSLSFALVTNVEKTMITVSKDGRGDFLTVKEAIAFIPNNDHTKYTIYVKSGKYNGCIHIGQEKNNILLVGDGVGKTILISEPTQSSRCHTNNNATLEVEAKYFVAKDLTITNTADMQAGRAVTLRSAGSKDTFHAFHRCSIEGYQDTLFIVYGRKFFFDCKIYGYVDFIYGDAKAIFQNSYIYVTAQSTAFVTAQSRISATDDTGFVFQNCTIDADPNKNSFPIKTYLGRPWRCYSRTIVMESNLGSIIDEKGWTTMGGCDGINVFYREFHNKGDGAATRGRVKWDGFKVLTDSKDALPFTLRNFFVDGIEWLQAHNIPFIPGLISG